ncbi:hypothetical protein [uncultured Sneathia sp.]|nr:hypothetical protein [uncultured Sneathia sp.]
MAELLEHILSSGNMLVALNKVKANKGAGGSRWNIYQRNRPISEG